MIVASKGIQLGRHFLPPFEMHEGEFVILNLLNSGQYQKLKWEVIEIFNGKKRCDNVTILKPLTFVKSFNEPFLRRVFWPVTVGEYVRKYADRNHPLVSSIYELEGVSKKTKWESLGAKERRLVALLSVLTKTDKIIIHLDGLGAVWAMEVFEFVKEVIQNGCSVLLTDWNAEFEDYCSQIITLEWGGY